MKRFLKVFRTAWNKVERIVWTSIIKMQCKSCGENLKVNHRSKVSDKTILGKCVNFNGMHITGNGEVRIGDYFHSGTECMIITSNHNYDHGDAIPYDHTYIHKNVSIGNLYGLEEGFDSWWGDDWGRRHHPGRKRSGFGYPGRGNCRRGSC